MNLLRVGSLSLAVAALVVACSSSSSTAPSGGGDAGSGTTCAAVADALCARAVKCGSDGKAQVALDSAGGAIVYASKDYCTQVLTQQCGADAAIGDRPRIPDPAACSRDLGMSSCLGDALRIPVACGGSGT